MRIKSISNISKRKENQDNYWSAILDVNSREVGVLCVCDGMGGLEDGGKASEVLVKAIRNHFLEVGTIEGIEDVVERANSDIKQVVKGKSGTTCTLLMCFDGHYYIYNVGDSRCYKWRQCIDDSVKKLTEDHTVIQKFKNEGKEITEEIRAKYKNVLTKCVGVLPSVKYDIFTGEYESGDKFLVCSDGFWHTIKKEDFVSGDIMNLENIVNRCMELGEVDNITACILEI